MVGGGRLKSSLHSSCQGVNMDMALSSSKGRGTFLKKLA